jgi:hypothetical protein
VLRGAPSRIKKKNSKKILDMLAILMLFFHRNIQNSNKKSYASIYVNKKKLLTITKKIEKIKR